MICAKSLLRLATANAIIRDYLTAPFRTAIFVIRSRLRCEIIFLVTALIYLLWHDNIWTLYVSKRV